jgi:hypothetical protein
MEAAYMLRIAICITKETSREHAAVKGSELHGVGAKEDRKVDERNHRGRGYGIPSV